MNDKELISVIDHLAEKLGTTAGQLIDLYSQQITIHWYAVTAAAAITFVVALVAAIVVWNIGTRKEKKGKDADGYAGAFIILLFITIISFVVGIVQITDVDQVLLPKAAAAQQLIKSLR